MLPEHKIPGVYSLVDDREAIEQNREYTRRLIMSLQKVIMGPDGSLLKVNTDGTIASYVTDASGNKLKISLDGAISSYITDASGNKMKVNADGSIEVKQGGKIKDYWNGSTNITKTFTSARNSLMIVNDGTTDITVAINGITFVVKSAEVFDEAFDSFTQVVITTTSAYRAWARG